MIDDIDRRLVAWATTLLTAGGEGGDGSEDRSTPASGRATKTNGADGTDGSSGPPQVVLDPPDTHASAQGVSIYLLECAPDPPLRGPGRSPLQVRLRYLVTSWGETREDAHRLLSTLLFAAMAEESSETEMGVDLTPLDAESWSALGARPQPSFVLTVPLRQERPQPPIKYVRQPLVVMRGPMLTLSGTVLGPGGVPLPGARVEIAGLNVYEITGGKGEFTFRSAPGGQYPIRLCILAKGKRMEYAVTGQASDPITIHFDSLDKED